MEGLAALGDRPRKLMFSGSESLTGSERRVAELAGAGRSNRDIAQDLFVTPKTVENHLGRVYVKLGITGRKSTSKPSLPRDGRRGAVHRPVTDLPQAAVHNLGVDPSCAAGSRRRVFFLPGRNDAAANVPEDTRA